MDAVTVSRRTLIERSLVPNSFEPDIDAHQRRKHGVPDAGGVVASRSQRAAIPSPPAAPGTVTEPIAVSEPPRPTWNSSTMPLAPVWT